MDVVYIDKVMKELDASQIKIQPPKSKPGWMGISIIGFILIEDLRNMTRFLKLNDYDCN
jgi:hypothetical protein